MFAPALPRPLLPNPRIAPDRRRRPVVVATAGALGLALFLAAAGCADTTSDGGTGDARAEGDAGAQVDGAEAVTPGCSEACPAGRCDPFLGVCARCLVDRHCPSERVCREGECVDPAACADASGCAEGVCDVAAGRCVDCLQDGQCGPDGLCADGICLGPAPGCGDGAACPDPLVCHPGYERCLQCSAAEHCAATERCASQGVCVQAECAAGQTTCEGEQVRTCSADGAFGAPADCPAGQACHDGACSAFACTPNSQVCQDLQVLRCNADGTAAELQACPAGTWCPDGGRECKAVKDRVVIVFDTSGSMDRYPGTDTLVDECRDAGRTCPAPWPTCETAAEPLSILSISKQVFAELVARPEWRERADFALLRFAQGMREEPTCKAGFYAGTSGRLDGDDDDRQAPDDADGWFQRGLDQVLSAPFPAPDARDPLGPLLRWMDFTESIASAAEPCSRDSDCGGGGLCLGDRRDRTCHRHADPELRAVGPTPIGRTLFYTGEYLRQEVLLDGHPCTTDEDCPSMGYTCAASGVCTDPIRHCRNTVVLLFSDGVESVDRDPESFFHPWNQARRLAYGLRCADDADCLGGVPCTGGVCAVPEVETGQRVCSHTGDPCSDGGDCGAAECADPADLHVVGDGGDQLRDRLGDPIRVVVNAVDLDTTGAGNAWTARLGGGQHFTVSSADPEDFLSTLLLATDIKALDACVPRP